jgi:hypothetical protein
VASFEVPVPVFRVSASSSRPRGIAWSNLQAERNESKPQADDYRTNSLPDWAAGIDERGRVMGDTFLGNGAARFGEELELRANRASMCVP